MFKYNALFDNNSNKNDYELKEEGDWLFNCKQYEKAIECYNKAIIKNPVVAVYFTNRALCFMNLKQWEKVCSDCRRALEIDVSSMKTNKLLGVALIELGCYDEAIKQLLKTYNLKNEETVDLKKKDYDYVSSDLRRALKLKYEKCGNTEQNKNIELLSYLTKLVDKEKNKRLNSIEKSSAEKHRNMVLEIKNQSQKISDQLFTLFAMNDAKIRNQKVPDYMCSKAFGCNIMKNPVITPSGMSYDRKDIEEHLMTVGNFDPVTRKHLTADQLIPNLALKEIIEAFVANN